MRNRNWALDIPQYDVRAFQKVGRTMALYDSWGSDSNSPTTVSMSESLATAGVSPSDSVSYSSSSGSSSSVDYRNEGRNYPTGTTRPVNTSTWSVGADGQIYGNLQDAAKTLGVKPSELNAAAYANNPLLNMFPGLKGMTSFIGKLQDLGLPGYAMTPEEREAQGIYRSPSGYGAAGNTFASAGDATASDPYGFNTWAPGAGAGASSAYGSGLVPQYNMDPTGMMGMGQGYAQHVADTFGPLSQEYVQSVRQLNDPAYQAQQRARAMSSVQQQADAQRGQMTRNLNGMNISDGRFLAAQTQLANQTALGKVAAAMQSDDSLRKTFLDASKSALTVGTDAAKVGGQLASVGNDAAKAYNNYALESANLGMKAYSLDGTPLDWAKLGMQKYGIDNNVAINSSNNDSEILGTVLGAVLGGIDFKKLG